MHNNVPHDQRRDSNSLLADHCFPHASQVSVTHLACITKQLQTCVCVCGGGFMCVLDGTDDILILYSFIASQAVCMRQDYVAIMHLTCPALCLHEYLMSEA